MKPVFKYALAGLVLAAASSGAYASVAAPSSGNGSLVLFVRDLSSPTRVFAVDTGFTVDSLLNQASVTGTSSPPTDGTPITVSVALPTFHSDALQTFMTTPSALGYEYALIGGDSVGDNRATSAFRWVGSSAGQFDSTSPSSSSNSSLNGPNLGNIFNAFFGDLNAALGANSSVDNFSEYGGAGTNGATAPQYMSNPFGVAFNPNGIGTSVNTATNLYMLTSSGTGTASAGGNLLARLYQFADLTLGSNGTLTSADVGGPQVPLPAAVWLLGSALVGLGTVRRRRDAQAA